MKSKKEILDNRTLVQRLRDYDPDVSNAYVIREAADTIEELAALAAELQQQILKWERHQQEINDAVDTHGSYRP